MSYDHTSFEETKPTVQRLRKRLSMRGELTLALLPTLVVLAVLWLLETFSRQQLLFASLASSAFLIYLDPEHGMNTVRALVLAHGIAALAGLVLLLLVGPGYASGGAAMVITIVLMIVLDVVHPPAVSTALSFAFRPGAENSFHLFLLALAMIAVLVLLQRAAVWIFLRLH